MISIVIGLSKAATISPIFSTKPSLVATGLTCSFVTLFWNRWPLNKGSLHTKLSHAFEDWASWHISAPRLLGDHSTDHSSSSLCYFTFAKYEAKVVWIFLWVFLAEIYKSVAWWLRFGLLTEKLTNSFGLSDKLEYQRINLMEKKNLSVILGHICRAWIGSWDLFS